MSSSLQFNPREVLDHLHELGYTNITADQLKEFIKGNSLVDFLVFKNSSVLSV